MAYLQVRDFPEELHEKLRELARREHRSVSQQTIIAIEQCVAKGMGNHSLAVTDAMLSRVEPLHHLALARDQKRIERRQKVFENIDAAPTIKTPKDFPSAAELVREGREELDARIGL